MTSQKPPTAIVFAYHTVGVRCLQTLIDGGFQIPLVITHRDHPDENIWFESVEKLCALHHLPTLLDPDLNDPQIQSQLASYQPDYLFSFYFRHMIPDAILRLAKIAPLNMHGSLLPKYRGRVPINWAVLHGEQQTGATLHVMQTKPDAGDIVRQESVPIGPDQTAYEVFNAVSLAAVAALQNVLPQLCQGQVPTRPNDLTQGSYFGGRQPADGLIDWQQSSRQVYNLYRAVAPPYPGAFTQLGHHTLVIAKARHISPSEIDPKLRSDFKEGLQVKGNDIFGCCSDGGALLIERLLENGQAVDATQLQKILTGQVNA